MEFPDEWLPCDKVPKELRDMFETRNRNRKEGRKQPDKASEVKAVSTKQNEVYENLFHFSSNMFLSNIWLSSVLKNVDRSHKHLFNEMR